MSNTDKLENVKVELTAKIAVSKGWEDTVLISVDRKEQGQFTLEGAMALLRIMTEAVISRCGSRMDQRITDARCQITAEKES